MSTWFVETRLAWIRESAEIFGFINREHIVRKFGVSAPQASIDLRAVQDRWPGLLAYDKSSKRYVLRGSANERGGPPRLDDLSARRPPWAGLDAT